MNIKHVNLSDYSSLRIGGQGEMAIVYSLDELKNTVTEAKHAGYKVVIIGEGTNTFFSDKVSKVLLVKVEMKSILYHDDNEYCYVTADAGMVWDELVAETVDRGLWGLENLSLIPGTVGASPIQNIGAYGVELADVFEELVTYDMKHNEVETLLKEQCLFGYRDSLFKEDPSRYCIISITLKLSKIPNPVLTYKPLDSFSGRKDITLHEIRDLVIKTRQFKLPDYRIYPNTGSFFKNPIITVAQADTLKEKYPDVPLFISSDGYKVPAAWLIDNVAQMKGVKVGNVGTWEHQPLVVVNYGGATSKELLNFSDRIIAVIKEKTGITLEKEVNYVE